MTRSYDKYGRQNHALAICVVRFRLHSGKLYLPAACKRIVSTAFHMGTLATHYTGLLQSVIFTFFGLVALGYCTRLVRTFRMVVATVRRTTSMFFLFLTGLTISSIGAAFLYIMTIYYTYHPFP